MALGALDVSLYEMVRAYGAFANNGNLKELNIIKKITDAEGTIIFSKEETEASNVIDTVTSRTITAILQQAVNQGTATAIRSQYGFNSDLAGKTGTAQNYTDSWFMAYTPNLVVGTWVGASTPDIHFFSKNGSGSALAMPIAANILKKLENNPDFKNEYLTNFGFSDSAYSFLQCEPYHSTAGIKGFFEKLFDKDKKERKDTVESRVKSFFKRIFGGKN
jgi:penicillin-binding protein 1A